MASSGNVSAKVYIRVGLKIIRCKDVGAKAFTYDKFKHGENCNFEFILKIQTELKLLFVTKWNRSRIFNEFLK